MNKTLVSKYWILIPAFLISSSVLADEYSCKVYCTANSGSMESTYITVNAPNSSEAAKIADSNDNDKICRAAGYAKATSSTLSASQCNKQ